MSPFAAHRQRQVDARLALVRVEAAAAVAALRALGVEVELVGSLVNGNFRLHSDVDFLVTNDAGLSAGTILGCIWDHLETAEADLVFADTLSADGLRLMRRA